MKIREVLATCFVAASLLATGFSSFGMLSFVQTTGRNSHSGEIYEPIVWEGGHARATIAIVGLFLLIMIYRKKELMAWVSLLFMLVLYFFPVFVWSFPIPSLSDLLDWGQLRQSSLARVRFEGYIVSLFMTIGLAMFLPSVVRKSGPSRNHSAITVPPQK
jgi:hypothetical protein